MRAALLLFVAVSAQAADLGVVWVAAPVRAPVAPAAAAPTSPGACGPATRGGSSSRSATPATSSAASGSTWCRSPCDTTGQGGRGLTDMLATDEYFDELTERRTFLPAPPGERFP